MNLAPSYPLQLEIHFADNESLAGNSLCNLLDKATEEQILDGLEERDPDLAEQIRQLMFVFDDLVKIDDRGIQELVKNVKTEQWKIALKTASESVSVLIFRTWLFPANAGNSQVSGAKGER